MNPLFIVGVLSKGLQTVMLLSTYWQIVKAIITCCGIMFIYNYLRALTETPAWYLYAMWYGLNFDIYIPDGMANFTNSTMFRPDSRLPIGLSDGFRISN